MIGLSLKKKTAQVWVETVLYTLIGLALIGIVLGIVLPKINASKEKIIVEQGIESLTILDDKIRETLDKSTGNVRIVSSFLIKRGELRINSPKNEILFIVPGLTKPYSEINTPINFGKLIVTTKEERGDLFVEISVKYDGVANILYDGLEKEQIFPASSTKYSFSIKNEGTGGENLVKINIVENARR